MNSQYAPIARIVLRYLAAAAGTAGWANDQDMVAVACLIIAGIVEAVYAYAKRKGKPT